MRGEKSESAGASTSSEEKEVLSFSGNDQRNKKARLLKGDTVEFQIATSGCAAPSRNACALYFGS